MRRIIGAALVMAVLHLPASGSGQDLNEYTELVDRANAAHDLLNEAPEHRLDALRETALEADMNVVGWLDTFLESDDFNRLPDDQRALVIRNRFRWEYNVSALLIPLDRCSEARDRVRALLDRPMSDEELRPRLTEAYENAIDCINRPRMALLTVDASPAESEVFLDGVLLGLAGGEFEVALGEHTVTVRADGFISEERAILAEQEGQRIALANVVLIEAPRPSNAPTWYEWTLWGVGATSLGVGVGYLLLAADREDQLDNPPAGQRVPNDEEERGTVDDLRLVGYAGIGVGLAAAAVGTISYLLDWGRPGPEAQPPPGGAARVSVGLNSVSLQVPF